MGFVNYPFATSQSAGKSGVHRDFSCFEVLTVASFLLSVIAQCQSPDE